MPPKKRNARNDTRGKEPVAAPQSLVDQGMPRCCIWDPKGPDNARKCGTPSAPGLQKNLLAFHYADAIEIMFPKTRLTPNDEVNKQDKLCGYHAGLLRKEGPITPQSTRFRVCVLTRSWQNAQRTVTQRRVHSLRLPQKSAFARRNK